MNPFSTLSWFWRALRARSLTFSIIFALALLGVSVMHALRQLLHHFGAPWYIWLLAPFVIVGAVAAKEPEWVPNETQRRRWSRWIIVGAIVVALLLARCSQPSKPKSPTEHTEIDPPISVWSVYSVGPTGLKIVIRVSSA